MFAGTGRVRIASRRSFPFGFAQGFGSPADATQVDGKQRASLGLPARTLARSVLLPFLRLNTSSRQSLY